MAVVVHEIRLIRLTQHFVLVPTTLCLHACGCYRMHKVHYVLDEIIMGGMVLETNINQILTAINDQNRLHAASNKVGLPPAGGINAHGRPRGSHGGGGVGSSGIPGMRTR